MGPGMFDGFKQLFWVVFIGSLLLGACFGLSMSRGYSWVQGHVRVEVTR